MRKPAPPTPEALLAAYVKELREQAGLTQRDLGAKLGRTHTWIRLRETASRQLKTLEFVAWCRQCGVEPVKALHTYLNSEQEPPSA